jgi:formylglycine-generating enzyme required for sulfatase activity
MPRVTALLETALGSVMLVALTASVVADDEEVRLRPYATTKLGVQFCLIEEGPFEMGGSLGLTWYRASEPAHSVWLHSYYMQATEVTVDQFVHYWNELFSRDVRAGYRAVNTTASPAFWYSVDRGDKVEVGVMPRYIGYPMTGVTHEGAVGFAEWLSKRDGVRYRLPTEAEWEKAARGGRGNLYSWGNEWDPAAAASVPGKVGSFKPNPFGLHDMTGNVGELCSDYYDEEYYKTSPDRNPTGPERGRDGRRVVRGETGGDDPRCFSTVFRTYFLGGDGDVGFRLVREVSEQDRLPPLDPDGK